MEELNKNRLNSKAKTSPTKSIVGIEEVKAHNLAVDKAKNKKSVGRNIMVIALSIVISIVVILGGYVGYLQIQYHRIFDKQALAINNQKVNTVALNTEYSILTYNIGFGAYDKNFSFFMDKGQMLDGTKTKGTESRSFSLEQATLNTNGAISTVTSAKFANTDFYFFQEVDTKSSRSYKLNQFDIISTALTDYSSNFASNFHSGYLFYPIFQPHGYVNSGIATYSNFEMNFALRRQLPVDESFFNKFFDLDRCISITETIISGLNKKLMLINVHLSAYDDGTVREDQLEFLREIMVEQNRLGNYVIIGGDFNHALAGSKGIFNYEMETPSWCKILPLSFSQDKLSEIGYTIQVDSRALASKMGTCRDSSIPYTQGTNFEVILDGFITSSNVSVTNIEVVDTDFTYSDHNPVYMQFKLI